MKKLIIAAMACAMPLTASAKGWGFTATSSASFADSKGYAYPFKNLPTLDIRQAGWVIQLDALELLHGMTVEEFDNDGDEARQMHFGINGYKTVQKHPIREDGLGGVLQPGVSFDLDTNTSMDPMSADIQFQLRMGARSQKPGGMGIGIYVVPGAGFAMHAEEVGLAVSGDLQISVWRSTGK